jgi:hypothetical protein
VACLGVDQHFGFAVCWLAQLLLPPHAVLARAMWLWQRLPGPCMRMHAHVVCHISALLRLECTHQQ